MNPIVHFLAYNLRRISIPPGKVTLLFIDAIKSFRPPWEKENIISQMVQVGVMSVPVVMITGIFTGMVLAAQTYYQFHKLTVETVVGLVVGLSMTRELGPVLTGVMLAGRVGAAFAAEIGTMNVTEQIDALHTLATDPVKYLVCPRLLACAILLPVLTIITDFIGIAGGYFVGVKIFGINSTYFLRHMSKYMCPMDIIGGLIKALVFGIVIAIIGCYKGFNTEGGAEGVGRSTTGAVVTSCILILVLDFFIVFIYKALGIG
jgi:phospholipid/cholesterol/gamma-HCH transport system permease protein